MWQTLKHIMLGPDFSLPPPPPPKKKIYIYIYDPFPPVCYMYVFPTPTPLPPLHPTPPTLPHFTPAWLQAHIIQSANLLPELLGRGYVLPEGAVGCCCIHQGRSIDKCFIHTVLVIRNSASITALTVPPVSTVLPQHFFSEWQCKEIQTPRNDDIVVHTHQEWNHHACKSDACEDFEKVKIKHREAMSFLSQYMYISQSSFPLSRITQFQD